MMKLRCLLLCFVWMLTCYSNAGATPTNLVNNPGFEEDTAAWRIPANTAKVVDTVAHSGSHSLYYDNNNPNQYKIFSQRLNVHPGQMIRFSAWVKGENVAHKDGNATQGAGIFVQSSNAQGKVRAGRFPQTISGTFDWRQVQAEYLVYGKATNTTLGLYLRRGVTGKVWFDDIEVTIKPEDPLDLFLEFPNYRGTIKQGDNTPWKFRVQFNDVPEGRTKTAKIHTILTNAEGKVLLDRNDAVTSVNPEITLHPPANLTLGNYHLQQIVTDSDANTIKQQNSIHVVQKMPDVYVDAQGFTVVNGKRFFPLGLYLGPRSDEDLQRIADGGFNTVLCYAYGDSKDPESYMDRAAKHNLKVIYSLKDMYSDDDLKQAQNYINQMRYKPALLSWYINDELGPEWLPKLGKMYGYIKQGDPNHPAYQVLNRANFLEKYFWTTDTFGMDSYPIGAVNLSQISSRTQRSIDASFGAKGVWMVTQIYDKAAYDAIPSRQPTLEEMRNEAYQAIIHGATGLLFYSYFDLFRNKLPRDNSTIDKELFKRRWPEVAAVGQEIRQLIPAILHGNNIVLQHVSQGEVQVKAIKYKGELLILLANPYYEPKTFTMALPANYQVMDTTQGNIQSHLVGEKMVFSLPPVGSGVFHLKEKTVPKPTHR